MFLAVGFAEEFLFRGYLQFTLTEGMGFWPAALLLSLIFGAVHLRNPGEGVVGALSVFAIGMFLCLTLRRTGDLWLAIGWHAAFDFGETYLYSVPNSGLVMPGHLFAASLHGPRWLTGGSVGPEGSVFSFAVLAVAAVVVQLASTARAKRKPQSLAERSARATRPRRAQTFSCRRAGRSRWLNGSVHDLPLESVIGFPSNFNARLARSGDPASVGNSMRARLASSDQLNDASSLSTDEAP